ncbi:MAG: YncE family protein [Gammaproteobacteria bacterium]|nr:YncE family protein [Gammaproteobacteria bacterium]
MKTLHFLALAVVMIALPTAATAGTLLVANKSSKTLTLVDAQTGEIESVLPTEAGPHEVDVSPDGRTAVVANYGANTAGNTLTVIDIPGAHVTHTIDLDEHTRPHGVVWLNDNRRAVVTTEGSQSLLVVDISDGKIEQVYPTDQDVSHMVAVRQAQGNEPAVAFVSSIGSGTVTKIVLGDDRVVSKKTGDGAEGIAVSPDGETVWIANRGVDNLVVLDTDTLETRATLDTGEFPLRVEFTHDGEHAVVTNAREDTLSIYDVESLRFVRKVALGVEGGKGASIFGEFDASVPIGIQPAPGRLWIAHANGDRVSEVDTETWKVTRLIDAGKEPDGMGYSRMDAGTIE